MSGLFSNLHTPFKSQIRNVGKKVILLRPRGKAPRNEIVPIQFQENLPKIQEEIKLDTSSQTEKLKHLDYFNVHNLFTVADLYHSRVHYGHTIGTLDDRMKPYIYGKRMGHVIFDLDKTAKYLRNALNFAAHVAYRDGIILFITRDPQMTQLVDRTAIECKEFSHTRHWITGVFTNSQKFFQQTVRLPDLCIFLNTLNDVLQPHDAVKESAKLLIPTIGIVDSNCNPNLITYPVPGNDDSLQAVEFYCKIFKQAILRGKEKREEEMGTQGSQTEAAEQSAVAQ